MDDKVHSTDPHLHENKINTAKNLATKHIRFQSIQPSDLVDFVRNSGLVEERLISGALEAHALSAQKKLEDRHFSKERKASCAAGISVSEAGSDIINGFYKEDGVFKGLPKYTRKCFWKGEERMFVVYRWGKTNLWNISIVEKSGVIGNQKNDSYKYSGRNHDEVPKDGWEVDKLGKVPTPKIHIE